MFSSSLTVSELGSGRGGQQNYPRGARSLHGSQSHSNLQFSSFPNEFGANQPTQQYQPGYLLATSQGRQPGSPHNYKVELLESTNSSKRGPSAVPDFGSQSLLSVPRPSPKGRSPRAGPVIDENAPPTTSILDTPYTSYEQTPHRLQTRHSVGGFFPSSSSSLRSSFGVSSTSSISTLGKTLPEDQDGMQVDETSASRVNEPKYHLIVFGFKPDQRDQLVKYFVSAGEDATSDIPEDPDCNWFKVSFKNEWEAHRAVRKNGEILFENTMIGVRHADDSQNFGGDTPRSPPAELTPQNTSSQLHRQNSLSGASNNTFGAGRSLKLKPSSSAFKSSEGISTGSFGVLTRSTGTPGGAGGDWGLNEQAKKLQAESAQPAAQANNDSGVLGKLNNMVFGW